MGEFIRGKQLAAAEITNREIAPGALTADATGRAIIAAGFFDLATVTSDFAVNSVPDSVLVESYIKANGTRPFTASQSMGGFNLTSLADPVGAQDAATKNYVDSISAGLDIKASSRVATTAALAANTYANGTAGVGATLTANANGSINPIDGVTLVVSDRILVKNEATASHNGIYTVTQVGTAGTPYILTRATDDDSSTSTPPKVTAGNFTFIEEGTVNDNSGWVLTTNNPITMGTTALNWAQFSASVSYTFRNGLVVTGSFVDVTSPLGSLTSTAGSLETTFATPATPADAAAATAGTANSSLRSDAKLQVSTGTPSTTVKTDASSATTGTAATLIRTDAQLVILTAAPSVTVKSDATSASQGTSTSSLRADAQFVAQTAAPTAAHVLSDAGAVVQGTSQSLLRADATFTALTAVPTVVSNATNTNAQGTSTSLARADHQHQDYYLTKEYRRITAAVANGTSQRATGAGAGGDITTAKGVPSGQGFAIYVKANGVDYSVGDGVNTGVSFWFTNSAVSGATPLAFSAVGNGAFLWCNTTQLGFKLDAADSIDIIFDSTTI